MRKRILLIGLGLSAVLHLGDNAVGEAPGGSPRPCCNENGSQRISLRAGEAFRERSPTWRIIGGIAPVDGSPKAFKGKPGNGLLIASDSIPKGNEAVTKLNHGDIVLSFDFILSKATEARICFQGRYALQLAESWDTDRAHITDCGALLFDSALGTRNEAPPQGKPPRFNVYRAPGLWQTLRVRFRAPRFNAAGKKLASARFDQVFLNGTLIHEGIALPAPSGSSDFENEVKKGPIVIQHASGSIAIRNICYKLPGKQSATSDSAVEEGNDSPAMPSRLNHLTPETEPIVFRSYMRHQGNKLLKVVSVGHPQGIHYAVNLEHANLIQVWKGGFLNTTPIWQSRGMEPNSRLLDEPDPLGSLLELPTAPLLTTVDSQKPEWPDSPNTTALRFQSYRLGPSGMPTFHYRFHDMEVTDKIRPGRYYRTLRRTIEIDGFHPNPPDRLRVHLAGADAISRLSEELYSINKRSYYLSIPPQDRVTLTVRDFRKRKRLLASIPPGSAPAKLNYSIIW